jgi:hypothetical protein
MLSLITLITASLDSGPFDIYSNVDGFITPIANDVSKEDLLAGYTIDVPEFTTTVRIQSDGICENYIDILLEEACFKFLPTTSNYMITFLESMNGGLYYYGNFTGYTYGSNDFQSVRLVKLNENLSIDNTWNATTGLNQVLYTGSSIIEQSDGKILASGTFTTYKGVSANRIVRINTDGTRDTSFVIGTGFNNFTQEMAIDSLGRIIVTGIFGSYNGVSSPCIAVLLPNGTKDPSFIIGSGFSNTTTSVIVNADDSLIVTGYFNSYKGVSAPGGIAKINSNGSRDLTFNSGSGFSPWWADYARYFVKIPGETSYYVIGRFTSYKGNPENYIIKLDINGNKDLSFDNSIGFDTYGTYVGKIVFGDKLLVLGSYNTYKGIATPYASVLNPDGSLFWANSAVDGITYDNVFVIGNNLYGSQQGQCLTLLYTYVPSTSTTTTTTI